MPRRISSTDHAALELRRRTMGLIAGVRVPIATAEDVIIAKLGWARDGGSERQLADVAGILAARRATLDLEYLEGWIAALSLAALWARAQELAG